MVQAVLILHRFSPGSGMLSSHVQTFKMAASHDQTKTSQSAESVRARQISAEFAAFIRLSSAAETCPRYFPAIFVSECRFVLKYTWQIRSRWRHCSAPGGWKPLVAQLSSSVLISRTSLVPANKSHTATENEFLRG